MVIGPNLSWMGEGGGKGGTLIHGCCASVSFFVAIWLRGHNETHNTHRAPRPQKGPILQISQFGSFGKCNHVVFSLHRLYEEALEGRLVLFHRMKDFVSVSSLKKSSRSRNGSLRALMIS